MILDARDYREFILRVLEAGGQGRPNFAEVARRAGFASRSFPRDVVVGTKRLTLRSLAPFARGLRLNGELRQYFELLVACTEPQVNQNKLSATTIDQRLARLKQKILTQTQPHTIEPFYEFSEWLDLYAASGTGATAETIALRSQVPLERCRLHLPELVRRGLLSEDSATGKFSPCAPNLVFDRLGKDHSFRAHYFASLTEARGRAEREFDSPENLFLNSSFSIAQDRVVEFRQELRSVLLKYVEEFEDGKGDRLAKLTVAFWPK